MTKQSLYDELSILARRAADGKTLSGEEAHRLLVAVESIGCELGVELTPGSGPHLPAESFG